MRFLKPTTRYANDVTTLAIKIPVLISPTIKSSLSAKSCLVTSIHHKMNIMLSATTSIRTSNISVPVSTTSFIPKSSFT